MVDRDRNLNVRASDEELDMLKEVARFMGLKQSDTVRQLIRQAYAELPKKKATTNAPKE